MVHHSCLPDKIIIGIPHVLQALISLNAMYDRQRCSGQPMPCEAEFRAYHLLTLIGTHGRYRYDATEYQGALAVSSTLSCSTRISYAVMQAFRLQAYSVKVTKGCGDKKESASGRSMQGPLCSLKLAYVHMQGLSQEVLESEDVQRVVSMHQALESGNWSAFLKQATSAPYLQGCLAHMYFQGVRATALNVMAAAGEHALPT